MGASVTIKSYLKEREKEIIGGLEKSMEKAGALVERQAKINVIQNQSKSPWKKTGELASNIGHEVKIEGNSISVIIGNWRGMPVQKYVPYAKALELGHVQHPGQYVAAIGKRLVASDVPPYPWLFPAVEMKRPQIIEALKGKEFTVA